MGCQASRSNAVTDGVAKVKADSSDGAPNGGAALNEASPADATPADAVAADGSAQHEAASSAQKNVSAGPSTTDLPASSKASANGSVPRRPVRKKPGTTANDGKHMTLDEWFNYSFEIADVSSRAPPKQIPRAKIVIGAVSEAPPPRA